VATGSVVGLGLCVVDHTYRVEGFDPEAQRIRFTERRVSGGGMVANALAQVAALGCTARVLSVVGADADGRLVRRFLREAGVRTGGLVLSHRVPTTVAVVLVDRRTGERRFVVPDRRGIEARAPVLDLSVIRSGCLLLLDGHFPEQALQAARRARELGATVIGDFHRPLPIVRRLLRYVDHPIVSHEYVEGCGHDDPRKTLRELGEACRGQPVVTLGRRGGLYLDGARVRRFRAHRARVVDTTGAGDVFHGAFAAGLAHGMGFADALDLGARAAALNCGALGGAGRLMTRGEMPRERRRAGGSGRRGR
jgi:sulfofructose kinase